MIFTKKQINSILVKTKWKLTYPQYLKKDGQKWYYGPDKDPVDLLFNLNHITMVVKTLTGNNFSLNIEDINIVFNGVFEGRAIQTSSVTSIQVAMLKACIIYVENFPDNYYKQILSLVKE